MPEEEKKEDFPVRIKDERPFWERLETIVGEEFAGLTKGVLKHGCTLAPYIPPNGIETIGVEVWNPRYGDDGEEEYHSEDYDVVEKPYSYYMVQDGAKRDICILTISPGELLNTGPYITKIEYVGPPEEKEIWDSMIENLHDLHIY